MTMILLVLIFCLLHLVYHPSSYTIYIIKCMYILLYDIVFTPAYVHMYSYVYITYYICTPMYILLCTYYYVHTPMYILLCTYSYVHTTTTRSPLNFQYSTRFLFHFILLFQPLYQYFVRFPRHCVDLCSKSQ